WKGFVLPNIVRFPEQVVKKIDVYQSGEPLIFGFLSRIDPKKGLELLFEALSRVAFDFRLRIGGKGDEGYLSQLKKKCSELAIDDKVEWSGWFSGEEKFGFLASLDILVLTSYNENFANVVLESLLVGTPVLLSNQVGMAEFVDQSELGWVCGLTVPSIVERLNHINQHRESIAAMGQRSPDVIKKNFNRVDLGYQYSECYEQYSEANSRQTTG
ncbi:MAG: glycosyltransferase, partial [Chitinophagaceae bacterium]